MFSVSWESGKRVGKIQKFVQFFFSSAKLIFRALPQHQKERISTTFLALQAIFLKKKLVKIGVFGHFLENYYILASSKLQHNGRPWMNVFVRVLQKLAKSRVIFNII